MTTSQTNNENMSLIDALKLGQELIQSRQIESAEELYRQLFRAVPDHAEVIHMLGVVLLKTNRAEEASVLLEKSLQINPAYLDAIINLGNAFLKLEFLERAEQQFRTALRIDPENTETLCSLANLLKRTGKAAEAMSRYRETLAIDPGHRTANTSLGLLLHQQQRHAEACEISKAWLDHSPDNESAKMLHASLSGENVPDRASDEYVRNMFDNSAADFDSHLESLNYRAPRLAEHAVKKLYTANNSLSVLDAGCGTGLCGRFLKIVAENLTGVDLSPQMIKLAEQKNFYDTLEVAELTDYLSRTPDKFDLIVSIDTFCYFGPLERILKLSAEALTIGGRLIFSLEELDDTSNNFKLHAGQRYNHTLDYIKSVIAASGLNLLSINNEVLRNEGKIPVNGFMVVTEK